MSENTKTFLIMFVVMAFFIALMMHQCDRRIDCWNETHDVRCWE